jgi:hypothetical protein
MIFVKVKCIVFFAVRTEFWNIMRDVKKIMAPTSIRKYNCNYSDLYKNDSYIFCKYETIFPQSLCYLQHNFENVQQDVKFRASTSEHITKTLFQFVVNWTVTSTYCIIYRTKRVAVGGWQIWDVSRKGKNSPSNFCDCFTCAQAGVKVS